MLKFNEFVEELDEQRIRGEEVDQIDEGRNESLKALEMLVKKGGIDKADFQKAHDLYKAAKLNDLKNHIKKLDTDAAEAIADIIQRHDSRSFNSMYPRAKSGDYLAKIIREVDEATSLRDIKNKKEREDKRKKDGETRQQRMKRKVYGNMMGGLKGESTAAYAASLERMANDKKLKDISPADRKTLAKLADLMKKANNK